jgi:hypothetical protein
MTDHEASRTLVKSPPELWAECSDAASLARHLGEFGEIKITRLEPESTIAWEGERASGTVRIEPSAWGTRVTLTAQMEASADEPAPEAELAAEAADDGPAPEAAEDEPVPEPELAAPPPRLVPPAPPPPPESAAPPAPPPPAAAVEPAPAPQGLLGRLRSRWRVQTPLPAPPQAVVEGPEPVEPEPVAAEAPEAMEPESEPLAPPEPSVRGFDAEAVLTAALDSLGQAHHRPYSRA